MRKGAKGDEKRVMADTCTHKLHYFKLLRLRLAFTRRQRRLIALEPRPFPHQHLPSLSLSLSPSLSDRLALAPASPHTPTSPKPDDPPLASFQL